MTQPSAQPTEPLMFELNALQHRARSLGFADARVARFDTLGAASEQLSHWLAQGMQGGMDFMARSAAFRRDPALLLPQARSAILLRMDYLTQPQPQLAASRAALNQPPQAQVSLYAQGRDYHLVLRSRAKQLVAWLRTQHPQAAFRVFTDSAPVMEVALARASGLGWCGKHTLLLNREAGSMFFLGGILTTLDLTASEPISSHCGHCTACIDVCPTRAIVAPYVVDARRCISYLTIEHAGAIAPALRPLLGNRIYGCDDCQTACPWNKYAQAAVVSDFAVRNGLDSSGLLELWAWSETQFLDRLQGSAVRRIGHARWLRNIATALGNALRVRDCAITRKALRLHAAHPDSAVREHVAWALAQSAL